MIENNVDKNIKFNVSDFLIFLKDRIKVRFRRYKRYYVKFWGKNDCGVFTASKREYGD